MIPIKEITIRTEKRTDEIITILNWQTHQVKNIWFAKTNWFTSDSTRALIGNIDKENLKFTLTRPRPFIELFIPQVIVKGEIKNNDNNKIIVFKFLPGLNTTAIFLFIVYTISSFVWTVFNSTVEKSFIVEGIIVIATILLIAVFMTIWELNKTKDKILSIIELK